MPRNRHESRAARSPDRAGFEALLLAVVLCAAGCASSADRVAPGAPCSRDTAGSPAGFESVFRAAAPAVVRVISLRYRRPGEETPAPFQPLDHRTNQDATLLPERSGSSGFIVSDDGLVLASAHAVLETVETWVELRDGYQRRARVLGVDRRLDLALLKIEGRALPVLRVSRDDPRPGQWVAAMGAPFGLEQTISAGVVSAFPRELPGIAGVGLIQTDVAINPGSSGGPLLDACGQVIGMTAMILSAEGLHIGVAFAVPARRMLRSAAALLEGGVRHGSPGWSTQSLTPALAEAFGSPSEEGTVVLRVDPGGAAAEAGLREGDIVLAVDGTAARGADALAERLDAQPPRRGLTLEVWRDGERRRFEMRLRSEPPFAPASHGAGASAPRLGLVFGRSAAGPVRGPEGLHVVAAEGAGLLAGIEEGDDIAAVNGRRVSSLHEFDEALAAARAGGGRTVALLISRDGARAWLPVRLIEPQRPAARSTRAP